MMKLEMREGCGGCETVEIESIDEINETCADWIADGSWGDDGAAVEVSWTLYEADGTELDDGCCTVEIEPNHNRLIRAAGGNVDCEHDWTAEGEGGCSENPGVWSTGGTSMTFATHCRICGLHRTSHSTGSQRNPGECDTVSYEQPDTWCAECQSEECECEEG